MADLIQRAVVILMLSSFLGTGLPIAAQAPKSSLASNKTASTAKCSGGWTGSVKYTRTQSMSDYKTVKRVSNRGEDSRRWEMNYNYSAVVGVVESPERNGSSDGKATINHSFTSSEATDAIESNSCDRGKTWKDMRGTFTSKTETTASQGGLDANVSIGVNSDGTYSVSVGVPPIKGKTTGEQKSSFSGQCVPKEGKTLTMPATETTVEGNSMTSDGTHKVDPADPNRLSGSYSKTWQNVTETISWNLEKCGAPLRLTDLKFEDMKFPNWDDWQEIVEQKGTIDGNLVKIKATVLNASGELKYANVRFKETYKGDKWDGARPDASLGDTLLMTRLAPGEAKEVELLWDSSGYAWFDDGRPRLVQRVKAELEESDKKVDEMTRNLKVAPKPLVLVHGLWSNWKAWEPWQNILTTSHSYDWKAFPVGEKADKGRMNTGDSFMSTGPTNGIADNARELEKYVKYAQEDRNAWHVDIVAHSMGGLISRYYIDQIMPVDTKDGRPKVTRLVMLGTPNLGSPCADVMDFAFEILGKRVEAVRQLRTDYVEGFNKIITQRKGVHFSALAGNPLPTICKDVVWNDGVVTVPSAKWTIGDTAESSSLHTDLTGTKDFSDFVKPRLAVGPKGNHNPALPLIPRGSGSSSQMDMPADESLARVMSSRVYGARDTGINTVLWNARFAKSVKVAAKQVVEIDVPVDAAQNFGVTFMADPLISATLITSGGTVAAANMAGSLESRGWFRSLFFDKPTITGMWKIRFENTGQFEHEAIVTTWKDAGR
jgi:pimeloyl-ACP methyl ester carboxylesterase